MMTTKNSKKSSLHKIRVVCYLFFKRIFDIICSIVGIIFLIPLTLIVKIVYVCTGDWNSIFYRQKRLGKNGKIIKIFKYRTMVPNAEKILEKWLKENPEKRKEYLK